jgi:hypothetical protein
MLCLAHKKGLGCGGRGKARKPQPSKCIADYTSKQLYCLYLFRQKNVRSNTKKRRKEHKNNLWAGLSAKEEAVGTWLGQDKLPVCQPGRKRAAWWNFGR